MYCQITHPFEDMAEDRSLESTTSTETSTTTAWSTTTYDFTTTTGTTESTTTAFETTAGSTTEDMAILEDKRCCGLGGLGVTYDANEQNCCIDEDNNEAPWGIC